MIYSNSFSSSRHLKEIYNYQNNLLGNLRMSQLLSNIEKNIDICPNCKINKKSHYCIETVCKKRQLICVECDVSSIGQPHYMHDYTYILPLFSKDIFYNFYKLKSKVVNFHGDVKEQIKKIEVYLLELNRVQAITKRQIQSLQQEEKEGKIDGYIAHIQEYLADNPKTVKLADILDNVKFVSGQQCSVREQQIKAELNLCLNNLHWPKDPQKVLKQKLRPPYDDQKREVFISKNKSLQIGEIDNYFRVNYQFLTDHLSKHQIQIKLQSDLLSKIKFYESFIYHFKDCQRLFIDNGNVNHLRTPLNFRNLKDLQFNFNLEAEPQNMKIELLNDQLRSLVFRRFREEDIKILKQITFPCKNLKKLHIQFSNKVDLSNSKQLIQFIRQQKQKNLVSFTLKVRTQNEVKRLYGYLSKFSRQMSESATNNLNNVIIELLQTNINLTKIVIEGVRQMDMQTVMKKLCELHFLMDYKLYYQNLDLMTEIEVDELKKLEQLCYKRKRIFYALAKASKFKFYPKSVIDSIVSEFLI